MSRAMHYIIIISSSRSSSHRCLWWGWGGHQQEVLPGQYACHAPSLWKSLLRVSCNFPWVSLSLLCLRASSSLPSTPSRTAISSSSSSHSLCFFLCVCPFTTSLCSHCSILSLPSSCLPPPFLFSPPPHFPHLIAICMVLSNTSLIWILA